MAHDPVDLLPAARRRIERAAAADKLYLSPITAWEIGLLAIRKKLSLRQPVEIVVAQIFDSKRVTIADLTAEICWRANFLPGEPHRDPADRLLIATARQMNLALVTRDRAILDYAAQGHVATLEC